MNDRALRVLEQYDLEVVSMRRGRGAYILETTQGLRIFCDYESSERRAQFQNCVMGRMRSGGYRNVDVILPNKEGNLVSSDWDGQKYVVKEWYQGRECDPSSEADIFAAVRNLAKIHRVMHAKGEDEFAGSFTAPAPLDEIRAKNAELRKVRSFIRRRKDKCVFERLFQNSFPMYFEQAMEVQDRLEENGCDRLVQSSKESGAVCHGDYDQHHVLLAGQETATTGFEHCRYGLQINDLYRFVRKVLEKHEWNPRLGMRMLDQYAGIRPISGEERRLFYLKMLYPEKFRKLANYYLESNKAWISRRFLDKLEQQNRQQEARNAFVRLLR